MKTGAACAAPVVLYVNFTKYIRMISLYIRTFFRGKKVGEDAQGNTYYVERFFLGIPKSRKPRRWVIYHAGAEASKVTAQWHTWLHYGTDIVPRTVDLQYDWQKPHMPNLTGTRWAYCPKPQEQSATAKPYQAWSPKNEGEI